MFDAWLFLFNEISFSTCWPDVDAGDTFSKYAPFEVMPDAYWTTFDSIRLTQTQTAGTRRSGLPFENKNRNSTDSPPVKITWKWCRVAVAQHKSIRSTHDSIFKQTQTLFVHFQISIHLHAAYCGRLPVLRICAHHSLRSAACLPLIANRLTAHIAKFLSVFILIFLSLHFASFGFYLF